jgi:hypothetical protein
MEVLKYVIIVVVIIIVVVVVVVVVIRRLRIHKLNVFDLSL